MKILVIGGTGTIGKAVVAELKPRHEVIVAGSHSGDVQVDVTSKASLEALFKQVKQLDAVIFAAGAVHFGPLAEMTETQFYTGIQNKLMGQINTVLIGMQHLNPKGSFTLTSGILNHDPIALGANASTVNGAIDGFVKSAALELPKGLRINAVSPTVVAEAMKEYGPYFRGFKPVSAAEVALAYSKSVEGAQTGQIYRAGYAL